MIPQELTERPQWVVWRAEMRDGKPTKVPYQPSSEQRASSTDPSTWVSFEQATLAAPRFDGIGFVFTRDDPYVGLDFDACGSGGDLHPWVQHAVERLGSYTEVSPSGTGLHVIVKGNVNGHRIQTSDTPWGGRHFGAYSHGRFFTMSGRKLPEVPDSIEERQEHLNDVLDQLLPEPEPAPQNRGRPRGVEPLDLGDEELLDKACHARNGAEFSALYDRGDVSGHGGDDSAADLALCNLLAFWTGGDPERIDRLFRRSGLMRSKWEQRSDYRTWTITKALAGRTEFYEPRLQPLNDVANLSTSDRSNGSAIPITEPAAKRAVDGASFILDAPKEVPMIWGEKENVAWAQGESLILAGPTGVGKTTLGQQLVLARIGLRDSVLGMPVEPAAKPVLYIAADRPSQAQRSFARMVTPEHHDLLRQRLIVWRGPLPFDIGRHPEQLAPFVMDHGAGDVVFDSLKDVAMDLRTDEVGCRINHAFQSTLVEGIEVLCLHHQRKATSDNTKPKTLDDVYGSNWITAGSGSVIVLWGRAGDPVIEVSHLKQPVAEIGPLQVLHDAVAGASSVLEGPDPLALLRTSPLGVTVEYAAQVFFERSSPNKNEVEKARRKLEALVTRGYAVRRDGQRGNFSDGPRPARYFVVSRQEEPQ
ncbi:MAG: AAA family ATPase [Actinomycetota bacterium]